MSFFNFYSSVVAVNYTAKFATTAHPLRPYFMCHSYDHSFSSPFLFSLSLSLSPSFIFSIPLVPYVLVLSPTVVPCRQMSDGNVCVCDHSQSQRALCKILFRQSGYPPLTSSQVLTRLADVYSFPFFF